MFVDKYNSPPRLELRTVFDIQAIRLMSPSYGMSHTRLNIPNIKYIKTVSRQGSTQYLHVGLIYQDPNNDGTLQVLV